jgi:hypothetical protein
VLDDHRIVQFEFLESVIKRFSYDIRVNNGKFRSDFMLTFHHFTDNSVLLIIDAIDGSQNPTFIIFQ